MPAPRFGKIGLLSVLMAATAACLPALSLAKQQEAPPAPESQAFDRQAISGRLRQLEAVIREIGERDPVPREEYEQAKLVADQLIEESRQPGFFWLRVPLDTQAGPNDILVHSHLSTWLGTLDAISARVSRVERLDRVCKHYNLLLRLFRDAETRRVLCLAWKSDRDAVKESILFAVYSEKNRLESARGYLRSQSELDADDWMFFVDGLLW